MAEGKEMSPENPEFVEKGVEAAADDEIGENWLEGKPLKVRIAVQFCRFFTAFSALYFFLVSLSLMGDAFQALTGKSAGSLFSGQESPIVGLMIGIIATVLVQSSSTTTSIVVVLVGQGLIDVQTAIPIIMGSNIGTSVTSTIVSLGFAEDPEAYERGFAGATVHDMFNYLNVLLLLPLELLVSALRGGKGGILQLVAEGISEARGESELEGGSDFEDSNPIKKITNPILDAIIGINKDVITDQATGFPDELVDEATVDCELTFTFTNEVEEVLEIGCIDFVCDFCPEGQFNQTLFDLAEDIFKNEKLIESGFLKDWGDIGGGIAALLMSLVILIGSLAIIVKMLSTLLKGPAEKVLIKSLNHNYMCGNYVSIILGCAITFVVQSSSITTSLLTPLVAVGALDLENMFPYTLGANIGTTGTGLIAAAASGEQTGYTIALVHFFFNIFGTLFWYPIPRLRKVPLDAARFLGSLAAIERTVPLLYIAFAFVIYPLIFFAFAEGFRADNIALVIFTVLLFLVFMGLHFYGIFWYLARDGRRKLRKFLKERRARLDAKLAEKKGKTLVSTMALANGTKKTEVEAESEGKEESV